MIIEPDSVSQLIYTATNTINSALVLKKSGHISYLSQLLIYFLLQKQKKSKSKNQMNTSSDTINTYIHKLYPISIYIIMRRVLVLYKVQGDYTQIHSDIFYLILWKPGGKKIIYRHIYRKESKMINLHICPRPLRPKGALVARLRLQNMCVNAFC